VLESLPPHNLSDLPAHAPRLEIAVTKVNASISPRETRLVRGVIEGSPFEIDVNETL
jgi:hypothetical protein